MERNVCHEVGCKLIQSCCHDITDLPVNESELKYFKDHENVTIKKTNSGYTVDINGMCPNNVRGKCRNHGQVKGCNDVQVGGRVCNRLRGRDGKKPVPAEVYLIYNSDFSS